jgi:hypothetical protein
MPHSSAARLTSDYVSGRKSSPFLSGVGLVAQRFSINLATTDLALNVAGAVANLPAGCLPVGLEIDAATLDSGTALAYSVGILNSTETAISTLAADGGAAWLTGQTTGRSNVSYSGFQSSRAIKSVQSNSQVDRAVGILITTAANTAVANDINITLWYRAT